MTGSLKALLEGVIDYAGLFPPAKASMSESVANYLAYRKGKECWIVDRFVCPASRLEEMRNELNQHIVDEPVPVCVIGSSGVDWGDGLVHDAEAMTRFIERVGDTADIEAIEIRVPDHENLPEYLADLRSFNQVEVYCELPWSPRMAESLGLIAEQDWLGAKARTGGLEASAFPSSHDLAVFLQQCIQLELEFKLTAGLHHPFRSYRDEVGAIMHGFINVTATAALLQGHDLNAKEAAEILDCEDASRFRFTDNAAAFGEWEADREDIEDARSLFVGFGSCSVQEPIDELHELYP
jgi:hypothetical protein